MASRQPSVALIALALVVASALAVYPSSQRDAAGFALLVDMSLLLLASRGRRWALNTLAYLSTLGAVIFLLAGAGQLGSDPRYFFRGVALAVAAFLLVRARSVPDSRVL